MQYSRGLVALRLCRSWVNLRIALAVMIIFCASVEASPVLISRAIVRPIRMPGFNVSVFDDTTGAPIPQVQASDGGALINGRVYSAPNIIWAIAATAVGLPLSIAGVRLWRITTALGGGLSFAFAMWAAIVNTVSEAGLAPSQSMSDTLILLITGSAFLVGAVGGAFRIAVLPAIGATGAIGGASITIRAVILRPGLLVPPGLNQQLAFVNIIIVALGVLGGGLSVVFNQRGSMIFATSSAGSFLILLAVDLLVNGQRGMSRGLRFLFDMNANHLADLVGGGYNPPLSSQIIVGVSLGLIPVFCSFQHFVFPGPFRQPRSRDRTQAEYSNLPDEKQTSSSLGSKAVPASLAPDVAPGPASRNSVLSIFRAPGRRVSNLGPGSRRLSNNLTGTGALRGGRLDGPLKPSNERRGSVAYNFGQGVFTLPSELMRQQNQPLRAEPLVSRPAGSSLQRGFQPAMLQPSLQRPTLPVLREAPTQTYGGQGQHGYAVSSRNAPYPARPTNNINGPMGYGLLQQPAARSFLPRPDIQYVAPRAIATRDMWIPTKIAGLPPTTRTPLTLAQRPGADGTRLPVGNMSRLAPPAAVALSSLRTIGSSPVSAARTNIGLGMLRLSVDSIVDAYAGPTDTGYSYGGSRGGIPGRV